MAAVRGGILNFILACFLMSLASLLVAFKCLAVTIVTLLRSLKEAGRTTVVVHHDLQTVPEYFDHVLLLNTRVVAFGPTETVFTPEHIEETYGGKLTLLEQASEALARRSGGSLR